jgi:plasmid stability protein
MSQIPITLDDETLAALERRAEQNGRTVEEEIGMIVADDLHGRSRPVDLVEWSRRIRAMSPRTEQVTDSLELLREDRNR